MTDVLQSLESDFTSLGQRFRVYLWYFSKLSGAPWDGAGTIAVQVSRGGQLRRERYNVFNTWTSEHDHGLFPKTIWACLTAPTFPLNDLAIDAFNKDRSTFVSLAEQAWAIVSAQPSVTGNSPLDCWCKYVITQIHRERPDAIVADPTFTHLAINLCTASALALRMYCAEPKKRCAVQLRGPKKKPIVCGKEVAILSRGKYALIQKLIQAGESGLSHKDVEPLHGWKYLNQLKESSAQWRKAILMGGHKKQGYRLLHQTTDEKS
jgi:hypothetical protein